MRKSLVNTPSLSTLIAQLNSMIGPGKRFASINAMAVALSMHPTTLRRYMSMESDITLTMLDHISSGLGLRPDTLLDPEAADVEPAHSLVLASLDLLRNLPAPDLQRVFQMLDAYVSPSKARIEKSRSAVDLDTLTEPHAPIEKEGHGLEGVSRSGTGRHQRKGTR